MCLTKLGQIIVCAVLLFGIVGCQPTKDTSFLVDMICNPPCWQNIKPGETTDEQAMDILHKLPMVDQKKITMHGESWKIFENIIYFQSIPKQWDGTAYILGHKIAFLEFYGNLNTNFDEASSAIGVPKYVINIPTQGGPPGSPTVSYAITALDPDKGVAYTFDTADIPRAKRSEIRPDTPIKMISYFDPMSYDQLLEAKMFSMGLLSREDTLRFMKQWTGYGSIDEKYPSAVIK